MKYEKKGNGINIKKCSNPESKYGKLSSTILFVEF